MMQWVKTTIVNELAEIGLLMEKLKMDSGIEVTSCMVDDVDCELRRVGMVLLKVWSEKRPGMKYYIDFHYSEAQRLHDSIGLKNMHNGVECSHVDLRELQYASMYLAISVGLIELMMDLSMMN